jgi:hypothetical protein
MDGYEMTPTEHTQKTLTARLKAFRDRYRVQVAATLAVLAALTFIAAETVPAVKGFVLSSRIIEYITLLVVLDLTVSVNSQRSEAGTWIARNQDEALPQLLQAVPQCRRDGVDLIEYAGATILPLIREIRRAGVPMRMLVQHPDNITGIQKQRMLATLDTILHSIFENDQEGVEIRCYRLPFTVRGRRLGERLLEIGWLTPDVKRQTTYGHQNPSMIADLSDRKNEHLRVFFDRTFKDLWDNDTTEDGRTVLERLSLPPSSDQS